MEIFYILFPSFSSESNPLFCISYSYLYKRGRPSVFFFLSRDCFVSHHYLTSVVVSVCHLSRCHISEMSSLASDIELIDNDTIGHKVFSTDTDRAEAIINPILVPVRTFKRPLLISKETRLLRARSFPNIQVALRTFFPQESLL